MTVSVVMRRDALPLWVSLLLVFFLVLRVVEVASLPHNSSAGASQSVDTDSMQDLIQADLMAKTAYFSSLAKPGPTVLLDARWLHQALNAAETLQAESGNAPGAARRVILLRALSGVPPLSVGKKNHLDPLAAFTTALPAATPLRDKAQYAAEGLLWKQVFSGPLTAHQTDALSSQIRALPNIRWWQWPALSSLYKAQGDLSEANRYALQARSRTTGPLAATGLLLLLRGLLIVVGLLILIYLGLRVFSKPKTTTTSDQDLWPTLPERLPFSERRLGAGDLAAVFAVYLLTRQLLELLLDGFSGLGIRHLIAFPGLLTPFLPAIQGMPATQRSSLEVVLEAVTYLLSAVPPVVYLRRLARQRGASLADELGWGTRALGANIGYGIAGFALASLLIVVVALPASHLLRHAPAPSNPVIPQIIGTSTLWATLLLVGLASVAAPLVEELLFRGVLYNAFKLRLGVWPAIILTGLCFGFVHPVGIAEMLAIAVLGGVFAWMAETRKSLVPSITAHFLNNFTSTLLLLFALAG